jgi:hypothetical protein
VISRRSKNHSNYWPQQLWERHTDVRRKKLVARMGGKPPILATRKTKPRHLEIYLAIYEGCATE